MNSNAAQLGQLNDVLENLTQALIPLIAIACVVMIVMGGFHFLTAGGDKEGTARAQKTITYAIIGLILAVSAYAILYVIGQFLGINVRQFSICLPGQIC